jgi:hypothetical protein
MLFWVRCVFLPTDPSLKIGIGQKTQLKLQFSSVLRIQIRDLVPLFDPWIRDPRWQKNQDPDPGSGSRMNIPDHISESLGKKY